jgi:hypothetical protein
MPRFPVPSRDARGRIAACVLAVLTVGGPIVAGFHEAPNLPQFIATVSAVLLAAWVAARPAVTGKKRLPLSERTAVEAAVGCYKRPL